MLEHPMNYVVTRLEIFHIISATLAAIFTGIKLIIYYICQLSRYEFVKQFMVALPFILISKQLSDSQ
jgi:hypothetical protein